MNSEPGAFDDYDPSPFLDAADIVAAHDRVMVVEIVEPLTPKLATPVDLPPEYTESSGIDDGRLIAIEVTPVVAAVSEVIVGPDVDETVLFEIGCFDAGRLPSTIPGQQLLVFAVSSDPTLGPDLGVAIDTRLRDWMSVDADGELQPRIGLFGGAPTAPFFEGIQLTDVVDQLTAAAADSEESPTTDPGVNAMELSPSNPQPGDTFAATFEPDNQRGGYFTLEQRSGSEWSTPAFLLESDANGGPPTWQSTDGGFGMDDYGVGGAGPDALVMPDDLNAGVWRLCTANARDTACVELTGRVAKGSPVGSENRYSCIAQ